MTIIRDGNPIHLTEGELYEAYREQTEIFAITDVQTEMDNRLADGWPETEAEEALYRKALNSPDILREAAEVLLTHNETLGSSWDFAMEQAIETALGRAEAEVN
jgi:hypothetical protein